MNLPIGTMIDASDEHLLTGYNKWWINKRGYVMTQSEKTIGGKRVRKSYLLHRLITGVDKGYEVDHINHDKLDNRRDNLRICLHKDNGKNLSKKSNNSSGFPGVHLDKARSKWVAKIKVDYREIFLGRFTDIQDAVIARREAEIKYFGAFAPGER